MNNIGNSNKYQRLSYPSRWKQKGFSMLPTSLLFDERLSRSALVIFWVLTAHLFKGKQNCYPSAKTIAKEAHCSYPTVFTAIKELEKYGYLEIERKKGEPNKYYLRAKS